MTAFAPDLVYRSTPHRKRIDMMKRTTLLAIAAAITTPAFAAPETYTVDPKHTFPSFEVSHLGFSTQRGRFNASSGKVVLDRAAQKGSIDVVIDARSVDTGLDKLEEHLRGEDFFNVAKYPSITFKSSSVKFNGELPVAAEGELTLLGVTKPVTLTITSFKCGVHPISKKDTCGADATTSILRSDYGLKYALPAVGDQVKLNIQVEATRD
jgi:polyisoprenoid-binding protein YceI